MISGPKKLLMMFLSLAVIISASSLADAAENKPAEKVIVYYFHGTFRCPTCTTMEKYAREALEANFGDALSAGKVEFIAVNVEERGNEHFVDDYKLYTKTLILLSVKDGKTLKSKKLDKIWELVHNKQKFIGYVTAELSDFMRNT